MILDEPMAGLDIAMREELLVVLDGLHARGMTLLLATHDIDFAYRWADRIHLMAEGRCTAAFDTIELPAQGAAMSAARLPLPKVIELHRVLAQRGVLQETPCPRSQQELLALLKP